MTAVVIRDLADEEAADLGRLLVAVYSGLDGFPGPHEQPAYYDMLMRIGEFTRRRGVRVLVAAGPDAQLLGGVVYFGDMREYGSGGSATRVTGASGIRLLGVAPGARGKGVGKALTLACIDLARSAGHAEVVLHTTQAMGTAWALYERLGFARSADLDFLQGTLPVFGFRLRLAGSDQGAGVHAESIAPDDEGADGLARLLASLQPTLNPGLFVFVRVDALSDAEALDALAVFREAEGMTAVVPEPQARRAGLAGFTAAWITLAVHSDLQAVGLTAAFSRALADAGIACNVFAAIHHDHVFVPAERGVDALACLRALQRNARVRGEPGASSEHALPQ
ncbi:ACT domain-containing protein [Dokdonella sp.]|uniref:ACT domain-containing protein n=1 Tax=Dokdonella sp. TaxID=2291710 RepID=UPI002F420391